jgi:GDP/UDP-N,N'-diacetylbacillosamine 2-epimerase (hydrolysing)
MINKICFVSGSRAEYGLIKNLMNLFKNSPNFELQIIATAMHLSPEFGQTYKEIETDGFIINKKVDMLLSSDSNSSIAKSIGLGIIGFSDALEDLKPDLVVLLGDRTEMIAISTACLVMKIPLVHLLGGETTEGAYDEAIRHSITKMSQLHFVAAEEYQKRVVQLGEHPETVHLVGGLGVDSILQINLLSKEELEQELNFIFGDKNLLITFHPITLEDDSNVQMQSILDSLDEFPEIHCIFTLPNSDAGSRSIIKLIKDYCSRRSNCQYYASLGQRKYFSTIKYVDGVIGNSSSGLAEVPTFKKGTINIGNRQNGRLKAASVIDCEPNRRSIIDSIIKLYSKDFQDLITKVKNPYGDGLASNLIFQIISKKINNINIKKKFYNLW